MAGKQLSDGNPTGTTLGQSASDLIGFHGATPSDQRASTATLSMTIMSTLSGTIFGFTSSDAGVSLVNAVNEIMALLREKGLMA